MDKPIKFHNFRQQMLSGSENYGQSAGREVQVNQGQRRGIDRSERYLVPHGNVEGRIAFADFCEKILIEKLSIPECIKLFEESWSELRKRLDASSNPTKQFLIEDLQQSIEGDNSWGVNKARYRRFTQEELRKNIKLYEQLLEKLQEFWGMGEYIKMNFFDKFYLHCLWARVSKKLGHYQASIHHNLEASSIISSIYGSNEDWIGRLDENKRLTIDFVERMILWKLKKQVGLTPKSVLEAKDFKLSPKQALLSRCYISFYSARDNTLLIDDSISKSDIKNLINYVVISNAPNFIRNILILNSLDALKEDYKILFALSNIEGGEYCHKRSSISYFFKKENRQEYIERVLIHELMHRSLDRVFNNSTCPYFREDDNARKAYHKCMQQVLTDLVNYVVPFDELELLKSNTDYEVISDIGRSSTLRFPYEWSSSISLYQLLVNCFGPNGLFKIIEFSLDSRDNLEQELKIVLKNEQTVSFRVRKDFSSYSRMLLLRFSKQLFKEYPSNELEAEFITYALDSCFHPEAKNYNFTQPLFEFIEKYVNPYMQEYIDEHPCRERIDETLINDDDSDQINRSKDASSVSDYCNSVWNYIDNWEKQEMDWPRLQNFVNLIDRLFMNGLWGNKN